MLKEIMALVEKKELYQQTSQILFEDFDDLNDAINTNEEFADSITGVTDPDATGMDDVAGTSEVIPGEGEEPDPTGDVPSVEDMTTAPGGDIDNIEGSPMDDILGQPVGDITPEEENEFLTDTTVDLMSSTLSDTIPVPPANMGDALDIPSGEDVGDIDSTTGLPVDDVISTTETPSTEPDVTQNMAVNQQDVGMEGGEPSVGEPNMMALSTDSMTPLSTPMGESGSGLLDMFEDAGDLFSESLAEPKDHGLLDMFEDAGDLFSESLDTPYTETITLGDEPAGETPVEPKPATTTPEPVVEPDGGSNAVAAATDKVDEISTPIEDGGTPLSANEQLQAKLDRLQKGIIDVQAEIRQSLSPA